MAIWRQTHQPFDMGSLLLSLGLHVALATLVLIAGWHKASMAPSIMTVTLVEPPPAADAGLSKGNSGTHKSSKAAPALTAPVTPGKQTEITAVKNPVPPPKARKKRRVRVTALRPKVKAEVVQPKSTPSSTPRNLAYAPAPPSQPSSKSQDMALPAGQAGAASAKAVGRGGSGFGSGRSGRGQGSGGSGTGSIASIQSQYLRGIRTRILANRRYPAMARQRRMEGVVRLRFTLSATGALSQGVQIVKASGYSVLDKQAFQCVLSAAPFAPFPPALQKDRLTIEVPIVYRLKDLSS